ncbi:MAG: phosphatase PAP2 family protein [Candidatus Thorarchaeota archaeon]
MIFFDPQLIILLQSLLPYVTYEILNLFGDPIIYVVLLGLAYWCLSKRGGKIAVMLFMFSSFINIILKYGFGMPRPPVDLRQNPEYVMDQSYGFPSGATQVSTTFWGWATIKLRKWWIALVGVFVILVTSIARMGLGLHFLGDVIGGVIVGIIIVVWAYFLVPYLQPRWRHLPMFAQNWLLPAIALIFCFIFYTAFALGLPYFPSENVAVSMGLIFGFSIGITAESRYVNFSTNVPRNTKMFRALFGVIIALAVYYSITAAFAFIPLIPLLHFITQFIKYILIGFFGAFIIPVIFNFIEQRKVFATKNS